MKGPLCLCRRLYPKVLFRQTTNDICGSTIAASKIPFVLHDTDRKSGSGRFGGKTVLQAGILGWLGLTSAPVEEEDDLTLAVKRGILAIQEGDLARADRLLHIALKMAQDSGREEAITHIFCLLGNLALERNFPGQAERLLKTVVQRLIAAGEPSDSNSVVEISLKLAQVYASIGSLEQAEQGFQFCVATQQRKLGKGVVDEDSLGLAGMVLDQRAQFLLQQDRLSEAEMAWREAVKVAEQLHGEEGEQTLVVKNSLATLLSMRGQHKAALDMLERVVAAGKRQQTAHLSAFLVNLGLVQLKQGLAAEGRKNCREASRLASEVGDVETGEEADVCLTQVYNLAPTIVIFY